MKRLSKKVLIITAIIFSIITLLLIICSINGESIQNFVKRIFLGDNTENSFSYVVYDNRDKDNIKILVRVNSDSGIEYVERPDGTLIRGENKQNLSVDYEITEEQELTFRIKEIGKALREEKVKVNDEITISTSFDIVRKNSSNGYYALRLDDKTELEGYKYYYIIGNGNSWQEYTDGIYFVDYDIRQNNIVNEDGTVTIQAKMQNTANCIVTISETFELQNISGMQTISADSLINAVGDNDLKTGPCQITVNGETYSSKIYNIEGDLDIEATQSFGVAEDVATSSTYAQNMIIIKVNGNLTLTDKGFLTAYRNSYGGPKGMFIYCTGTITNNGTINMTQRGAKAEGQDVYMWQNATYTSDDDKYEVVPAQGATGAARAVGYGYAVAGVGGGTGTNRRTGGGASGRVWSSGYYGTQWSGAGADGTSYSGGSGGGAQDAGSNIGYYYKYGGNASGNGGAGGNGNGYHGSASGGAGNPGGSPNGPSGTGGLLIIYGKSIENTASITSRGTDVTASGNRGGGSGGGSVNIFYTDSYENTGSINTTGGSGGAWGGTGSISVGQIVNGNYVSTYANYPITVTTN